MDDMTGNRLESSYRLFHVFRRQYQSFDTLYNIVSTAVGGGVSDGGGINAQTVRGCGGHTRPGGLPGGGCEEK